MARYTGPKSKIARRFREPIFGPDKALERKNYPPGMHGTSRKRGKQSEFAVQLMEKQKVKYTYGVLERYFENLFHKSSAREGITGENLLTLFQTKVHFPLQSEVVSYSPSMPVFSKPLFFK